MRNYYGSRIHEYTEELAHHLTEAGAYEDAIEQWQEASRRALLGAGNLEALDALETAISLLDKLPKNILNLKKKISNFSL